MGIPTNQNTLHQTHLDVRVGKDFGWRKEKRNFFFICRFGREKENVVSLQISYFLIFLNQACQLDLIKFTRPENPNLIQIFDYEFGLIRYELHSGQPT